MSYGYMILFRGTKEERTEALKDVKQCPGGEGGISLDGFNL